MSISKAIKNVETRASYMSREEGAKKVDAFIPLATLRQRMRDAPFSNLWVFNTSDRGGTKPKGDINIAFKKGDEDAVTVVIPVTFIPINLADHGDVSTIIESSSFISYVNKGMIRVINPDVDVQAIFNVDTMWQNERSRLMNFADGGFNEETSQEEIGSNGVSPSVVGIMGRQMSERQRVAQLSGIVDTMTARDLRYVLKEGASDDVRQFAQSALAEREKEPAV